MFKKSGGPQRKIRMFKNIRRSHKKPGCLDNTVFKKYRGIKKNPEAKIDTKG